ncbi:MAG: ABC transporter ATP-binding protein [Candidatus Accumulibacter sp.]|uniref:ABC transporter ATP-binding protein n=1 Tax=Candidatus Accumulibacter affinis TaxID=2954384 RepID=A0A935TJY6_9PROT|nr:ABC transporter ATP-binding protein [Candidatus Accumulibacter affinis]
MSDILVKVDGVSKKFCRDLRKSLWYGMLDLSKELLGKSHGGTGKLRPDEFWALRDVSFELRRGECLGLIGRNGAGKTTLLRMMNGLIKPDGGRIEMHGRVCAMIALGAGFNPILTGRENIYVNASVLGLSKLEIDARLDDIIKFAEIGEFIDAPVQTYSSGMQVRLGFSVASALEPDVLLLDEILAVGDAAFRFKCHRRIAQLLRRAAVIFVSHDMPHVARISTVTMAVDRGEVLFLGPTPEGIEAYRDINEGTVQPEASFDSIKSPVSSFQVQTSHSDLAVGQAMHFRIRVEATAFVGPVALRINVFTLAGTYAADVVVDSVDYGVEVHQGQNAWLIGIPTVPLKAGRYLVSVSVADTRGDFLAVSHKRHALIVRGGHPGTVADCQLGVNMWQAVAE